MTIESPTPDDTTEAEVSWLRDWATNIDEPGHDSRRADRITLRLIDSWHRARRTPAPAAPTLPSLFDDAGIEALGRIASDAAPGEPAASHVVIRAVATAAAEAAFAAMFDTVEYLRDGGDVFREHILAQARASLKLPTAPSVDVRAAVAADRAAIGAYLSSPGKCWESSIVEWRNACHVVDAKTSDAPPPAAVEPAASAVEEVAAAICNAYVMVETGHDDEKHWSPEARAAIAVMARRMRSDEAVEAASNEWSRVARRGDPQRTELLIPRTLAAAWSAALGDSK